MQNWNCIRMHFKIAMSSVPRSWESVLYLYLKQINTLSNGKDLF
jgi:hypothetical protein